MANEDFDPVADAIEETFSVNAHLTGVGGGAFAIQWDTDDGYFLLTDEDGPLVPGPVSGWMVGHYTEEAQEEPDLLVSVVGDGSTEAAVNLVREAIAAWSASR